MICYVILHYQNIEVTQECVEKLKRIIQKESKIVVIDNASPNGSGEKLLNYFASDGMVIVLKNKDNVGFARGNNAGYQYAKNTFHPNIIVVMNSDVFIEQKNFEDLLSYYVTQKKYDLIAPDIISSNSVHQNPLRKKPISNFGAFNLMITNEVKRFCFRSRVIYRLYLKYKKAMSNTKKNGGSDFALDTCVPHGACIIYANKYLHDENFAFLPITFMYCEEDILYEYIKKKNYALSFCFDLQVNHLEDASTNASILDKKEKLLFIYKHQSQSLRKLLQCRLFSFDKLLSRYTPYDIED